MGVRELEITTPWDHKAVCLEMSSIVKDVRSQVLHLFISVECGQVFVRDNGVCVPASLVISKLLRLMVMIWHTVSKYGRCITERLVEGFPYPLHALVSHADLPIFEVDPSEEPSIETHLSKESRVGI